MASLFHIDLSRHGLCFLDAGAGSGILSIAAIDRLINDGYKGAIHVTCYETDETILPLLKANLDLATSQYNNVSYEIIDKNYITSQAFEQDIFVPQGSNLYDYVIGNPPYMKISKDAHEAMAMPHICHGAPNLYFLFWAMGIHNLKNNQELVYIIPRSWTSGAYFKHFRRYLFNHCVITDIHLFDRRDKVFDCESVLQETMIVKVKKTTEKPNHINITSSSTSDFSDMTCFQAPYETIVNENLSVCLVTNEQDAKVLDQINHFHKTLPEMNMRMQTGIIVDFRNKEVLRDELEDGAYPLLYSQHIKDGRVIWPLGKSGEVIKTSRKGFLQENSDFLLVKRFTSKEEKRRLQCGIYLKKEYSKFIYISTQNKINFIKCDSPCMTYGLYVLLNSSLYDNYYRILNGSTQVNSTEINQMPIPEKQVIEAMGRELMHKELSVSNCNEILHKWIS
ncbi:MAG: Eco57I restriction-modification methylase domain-containing protein [Prevotellaceae bacterium]|nr:Eco57I restriction-modification methylase domain-containing protein [Prevotellaceae bacterium]